MTTVPSPDWQQRVHEPDRCNRCTERRPLSIVRLNGSDVGLCADCVADWNLEGVAR